MARTRAGLSGRPTCRLGVICPGLSAPQGWPLAAMSAGLPVETLRPCLTAGRRSPRAATAALRSQLSGQRPAGAAFLSWLLVFTALVLHWCRCWPGWWCHPARLAAPQQRVMAAGHPFIGRGSRPKVGGTPKGCPGRRPLCGVSIFCRWSSCPQARKFSRFKYVLRVLEPKKAEKPI